MEFSQYVLDAISSINYLENDRDFHAASTIKGAAEKASNETDSHILDVIGGSITMTYNSNEQVFSPFFIEYGGNRSFAPEDLSDADIDILRNATQVTESSWLRTKFSHIVWTITNESHFGQLAVDGYLEAFQKTFDPTHWVPSYQKIQPAYHISTTMGKSAEPYRKTRSIISQKLLEMDGADPLFLSIRLLKLILKDLKKDELPKYTEIAEKVFHKNIDPSNENTHLADESFSILEAIYKRMQENDKSKAAKELYANYYETQARRLANKKEFFRAVILMKTACLLYSGINREKFIELRLEMENWQKLALNDLHPFTMKIDVTETSDIVDKMFDGLSLPETIVQFGRIVRIYNVDEVKQKLSQEQDDYFISSMWKSSLLNDLGQSVQELLPIHDIENNTNSLKKHMIRHVAEQRRMLDSIPVRMAFKHLKRFYPITEESLNFLVQNNAIIPDNRAEIIREGLCLALNGKLYTAMHILQPQTENIFRHLVKMCGDTVTFLKDDGTEEYKPLSVLLNSEKLLECYDNDIIFTFQSIMVDPAGENLRNLNGHGLLEPEGGNGTGALYFLSMLIMLLSLYSTKALSIRLKLSKLESHGSKTSI